MATELPHLIWIDCEMTGLDLATDALVEIAVLVTDSDLNVIGEGIDLVIGATPEQLAAMNDFVTQMHTSSGLITEIPGAVAPTITILPANIDQSKLPRPCEAAYKSAKDTR